MEKGEVSICNAIPIEVWKWLEEQSTI